MSVQAQAEDLSIDDSLAAAELELQQVLRRKVQLLEQKLALQKDFRLQFYQPHVKQDKFHRAGKKKRRYVRAGNRWGKSDMGVAEDCAWGLGYRPWYPLNDPARYEGIPKRPVKGLIIAADWDKVRSVFTEDKGANVGKFFKYLPSGMVKSVRRTATGVISFIELENGSTFTFDTVKSYQTNQIGAESDSWDFIHVDEPCPKKLFIAHARGLIDTNGSVWFTLTPLGEGQWINEMFFPSDRKRQQGLDGHEYEAGEQTEDLTVAQDEKWFIQGTIYDNPYLSVQAIELFLAELTPEERECRINGIPLEQAGRIYKEFDYWTMCPDLPPKGWANWNSPPRHYSVYYAIDPHPQTPHAVLFLAVDPLENWFFFDEIFEHTHIAPIKGQARPALSELVHSRLVHGNLVYGIMDPLGFIEHPITNTSMADELTLVGLHPRKATKDLDRGILAAKAILRRKGTVFFSPHLRRTIYEFECYHWDPKKPNKPVDKDDHMMENFYRLCLEEPRWIDPSQSNIAIEDMDMVGNASFYNDLLRRDL